MNIAQTDFIFHTRLHLSELTGLSASNLEELVSLLKTVNGSAIYHHTHRFLQQHQFLSPEPPNDFAYWVSTILGEIELGERLASIDIVEFSTIRDLRTEIIRVIEDYLKNSPQAKARSAKKYEEFYFIKSISFVMSTGFKASNLSEFADILGHITIDSVYYHMFESKLRIENNTNDFSRWIEQVIGEPKLAKKIASLDPYTHTLDGLRQEIIRMVKQCHK